MHVILLKELRGKGGEGDVIDVAQGYAENYLFPQGYALPATKGNLKQLEERRRNIAKREIRRVEDAETVKSMLDGKTVRIEARVGDEGQLFGSVTAPMIANAIQDQLRVPVDRRRVDLKTPIKSAGTRAVDVNLYREITATVNVQVGAPETPETSEASAQDEGADTGEARSELTRELSGDEEAARETSSDDALVEKTAEA